MDRMMPTDAPTIVSVSSLCSTLHMLNRTPSHPDLEEFAEMEELYHAGFRFQRWTGAVEAL